jgi:S-adenosylmethionine:tRNA ribosyltransferase-isomerase
VLVSDFQFHLPEELIAQEPPADRAGARLLQLDSGALRDRMFREFPEMLRAGDLVVLNNTRVFPARLYGRRGGVGKGESQNPHSLAKNARKWGHPELSRSGRIEVLLTRQVSREPNEWECLVRPGKKIGVGDRLFFGEQDELQAEVVGRGEFGERRIRFPAGAGAVVRPEGFALLDSRGWLSPHEHVDADFFSLLEKVGHVPLPPYISREDSAGDRERYQTVYARERGSVAAPTAGLHFTPEILECMRERGVETCEVTLHVGLGTFQPVRVERVEEHRLHSEAYSISSEAADKIRQARGEGRRIVAVGTTTVRTLEFAAQHGDGEVRAGSGEANIFIYPGYKFQVVRALLTNFHLPKSTLLMLVCALGGKENVIRGYAHAVAQKYRFYSYGDCMFVE